MNDIQTYHASYLNGIDAFNNGNHVSENPFPSNTHEHSLFVQGYMDAKNRIWLEKKENM